MLKLYELADNYLCVLDKLNDSEIDAETIQNTLESIQGELADKAENIARIDVMLSGELSAIDSEIKRLTAKKKAIENGQGRLKKYLFDQMKRIGKEKIKGELFTISIRKNPPKLIIDDPMGIPSSFLTIIPQHTEINNAELKRAIVSGEFVPGAHCESGESLQIK
jgi:hypothetical protein